jgi:hypothetical protein
MWGNIGRPGEWYQRGIIHNMGPLDPKSVQFADWV